MTAQVYYSNWRAKLPPEHENYFHDIGEIALLIAQRLNGLGIIERVEGPEYFKTSSISVSDWKEKYGEVRVYCELADRSQIESMFDPKQWKNMEEFVSYRYVADASLYRSVYLKMVALLPHYEKAITSGADHPEFLFKTQEDFEKALKKPNSEWLKKQEKLIRRVCWPEPMNGAGVAIGTYCGGTK